MKISLEKLKEEIRLLCARIQRTSSLSEYVMLKTSIQSLIDIHDTLNGDYLEVNVPENRYLENKMNASDYREFTSFFNFYIENISQYRSQTNNVLKSFDRFQDLEERLPNYYLRRFSKKDFIEIIGSFLNEYEPLVFKKFTACLENCEIDIDTPKQVVGDVTYEIFALDKSYILVDNDGYTVNDMLAVVHEIAHAVSFDKFRNLSFKQVAASNRNLNYEVYSLFLEYAFIDYLRKIRVAENDVIFEKNKSLAHLKESFVGLDKVNKGIDEAGLSYLIDVDEEYYDDTLIALSLKYGYGGLIALEFLDQYRQDRCDTKRRLHLFDTTQGLTSTDELLKISCIDKESLILCKVLKKELKNHRKDVKNILG